MGGGRGTHGLGVPGEHDIDAGALAGGVEGRVVADIAAQSRSVVPADARVAAGDIVEHRSPPHEFHLGGGRLGADAPVREVERQRPQAHRADLVEQRHDSGQHLQAVLPAGKPSESGAQLRHRGAVQVAALLRRREPFGEPEEVGVESVPARPRSVETGRHPRRARAAGEAAPRDGLLVGSRQREMQVLDGRAVAHEVAGAAAQAHP